MCLLNLQDIPGKWKDGGYGYKLYMTQPVIDGELYDSLFHGASSYSIGVEYKAVNRWVAAENGERYLSGFHCFVSLKAATTLYNVFLGMGAYSIVKVMISDVTAYGNDHTSDETKKYKCVVGNKIKLIERVK